MCKYLKSQIDFNCDFNTFQDATDGFTSYKSGVFYERNCPNDTINHAIVRTFFSLQSKFPSQETFLSDDCWLRNRQALRKLLDHQEFLGRELGHARIWTDCEKQEESLRHCLVCDVPMLK
jgi:hypothetical protein